VCAGGTINLTASAIAGATYAWTGPNGFTSTQQNPVIPNATAAAGGTYSVAVTVNGCPSSPATVAVQVDPQVATPTISGNNTFCQGGNTTLTSSAATGNRWFKDGVVIAGATGQTLSVSAAGSYSVTVASGACSASAAAFNVTQTNVTAPVISGTLAFCQGGSTVLTASTSTGNQWFKDGVAVGGATAQTFTATAPGDYTVTATNGGCTATSAVAKVTATPVPAAPVASSNGPVCAGANLSLNASPVAGGTYNWTGPNGFTSAVQNPGIPGATATAGGTYSVTVTVNGCTSPAATVNVTINPVPVTPTISGNNAICPGATTVLTSSAATGNQWLKDGTPISGETGQTLTVSAGGNYAVRATATGGCTATSTAFVVTGTSLAVPTISGNNTFCAGASTVLTSSAANGNQWYRNGSLISGATGQTFTATTPGDYSVMASASGCTATSAVVAVTQTPAPAAPVASSNGPICVGNTLQLSASAVSGAGYNWTGPNGFTATGQNVSIPNATASHGGQYTVTVTANGCSSTAAVNVIVSPLPAKPTISGLGTICAGGSTLLTSSAASGNQWYKDGVLISGATGQTLSVNTAGAYAVTVSSAGNCSASSDAFAVTQGGTFTVNVTGSNPNGCTASNGTLTATAAPAGRYRYSLNGTDFSNTTGVFNGLGAGNYTVYVQNGAGCVVQGSHQLTNGTLTATVAATGETACNVNDGTITLTPVGGSGPYTYAFRKGSTGGYTGMGSVNTLNGQEPGTYFLRVSDANCSFETTATVTEFDCNAPVCALTATAAVTNPTCSNPNGTIALTVSGGTAPFTYALDGTAFGSSNVLAAPAGTHSQVTVRDAANCVYVLPAITLTAPVQPSAPVANNPAPVCAGSNPPQLTATGSGLQWYSDAGLTNRIGTGSPFIPSMNTATAGTTSFYVTQTANGCQSPAATVAVSVTAPIDFSVSKTDPAGCATADGTITVTGVTGGTGSYGYSLDGATFQASAAFSGRGAGNYTVYVKDANNCIATKPVQLAAPGGFTATVTPTNETGCDAKDGVIRVTGLPANAAGYHYSIDGALNWAGATIPVFTGLEPRTYTITVEAQTPDKCTYTTTVAVGTDCVQGCVITASVTGKTDPSCPGGNNGSLTVSATGGSGTYEYSKDGVSFGDAPTFGGLDAGDYTITVRDKNNSSCQFVLSGIALSNPDALAATLQSAQPTCAGNDGSLTVTATGGSGTYSYSVQDGNGATTTSTTGVFANLAAGSYTVTVRDDKGCTTTLAPVTLTAGPTLAASVSGTNPTACGTDNGTITVSNASGGTQPYSYSLDGVVYQSSNTFSGQRAGSYTVYIRDAKGCEITSTQTLTAPGGVTATTGWTDETACNAADGTITVTGVTGATGPFAYFRGTVSDADGVFTNLAPGTYAIRVVAQNNCEYTTSVTVGTACTNPPVCTLTAGSSKTDPTCASPNGGSITVTATGGTAPYQYAVNSPTFAGGTGVFNNLPAGNYNITVRDNAGCTFSLNTVTLTAPAVPAAPLANSPAPVCFSETLPTLTATGTQIKWYDSNNQPVALTDAFTPTMSNPPAGTYNYFVTQTVNGCESARTTVTITVKAQPAAPTVTNVVYCQNATPAALTAGGNQLLWYSTATSTDGSANAPTVSTTTAGVFEYFVSQTVDGCQSPRARLTVTVQANPALPTITGNAAFCAGGNSVLTSSAASGNQWLRDGVLISGATNQTLAVGQAGTYSVRVSNANGCTATSAGLAVSQTTVAAPTISGTLSFCQGSSTLLTSSAATGNQWNLDGSPIGGQTGQTLTVTAAGNYSVTLTQNGCSVTSPVARVTVTPTPAAPTAASNGPVCVGSPIELTASLVNGASYSWTGPDGFASTQRNPVINAATAAAGGTYSVTVTVNGCTSPAATVNVAINPAFDFTLSSTAPTGCGAQDGRITVTPSVNGTYTYRVNDEEFSASSDVLTNLSAGTYTVSLKNAAGCVVQKTYQLAGPGGFTATAAATNEMACGAQDGTIVVTAAPAGTNYRYAIRRSGETAYGPERDAAAFENLAPGTYQVKVTDGNGCEFVVPTTVTGFTCPPVCAVTARVTGTTQPTCANPNGGAIAVTPAGGTAPYEYSVNNKPFGGAGVLSGLGAGNYMVRVKDALGCLHTLAAVTLTAPDGPAAPVITRVEPICVGAAITLNAGSIQANATFQWTGPNGFAATGAQVTIANATAASAGTYSATVTVNGCVSPAATVSVTVKPAVAAPAVADVTYCAGVQAGALTATGTDLKWYDAATGGTLLTTAPTPSTTTAGPQEYYVSQTVDGCESPRARIRVTVKPTTDPSCACNLAVQAVNVKPVKCEGENNGEIQIFILAGGSGSYEYSKEGGPFQDDPTSLVKGLTAGTYAFTVRDKVTGCVVPAQAKVTTEVIVAGLIIASPANTCGGTGSIEFREVSGTGAAPYQVSIDGGANYKAWPAGKLFPNLNPDTYQVAIEDANGCTYKTPVAITGMPKVSVAGNVTKQPATCSTTDGEVTVTVTGGTGPFQYLLNNEPVTPDASGKIGKLAAGKYLITVRDANQCDATTTLSVAVDPIEFTVEREEATCEKPAVAARAVIALQAGEQLGNYLFSLDGTSFVPGNPQFTNLSPGTYTMYVRRDGLNSCPVSKKFTISGVKGIAYEVSQVNVGCTGAAEGSITVSDIKGGTLNNADAEYGISIDGGATFKYTAENKMTFEALKPGKYQVVLAYGTGCRTAVREVVISSSGIPFTVLTTPATCGSPNGSAEAVVGETGKKYFYSINNTNFFEAPLFTNLKPGDYKMYIRENADDPCANVLPFIVGGPDSLKTKIRRENCNDIVLSPITGGVKPYRISVDGGNTFVSGNLFTSSYVISNLPDGNYEVVVIDNQDCRTFPVKIRINNTLTAKVKATLSMPDEPTGEIRITDIRGGDGPYEVSLNGTDWAQVKDTSIPYDTTITAQPVGDYIVYLRDVNGCVKVYPVEVKESTFLIPNVFTPNNDGVNDTFFIRNLPTGTIVSIVNRWGKVVFESSNYQNDWNGGEYPDGIYYYTVNIAGKGTYSGWVQIWH
jgi:gliding motility-associated-like protein